MCLIDIYSKNAKGIPLKDEKEITISSAFQNILDESIRKLNKKWVDQDGDFTIDQWNHV